MNAGLLALLIVLSLRSHVPVFSDPVSSTDASLKDFKLIAPPTLNPARGGGGGNHALIDPITGHLPKLAEIQLAPPQIPLLQNPILKVDSSIIVPLDMKIPDNPNLPNIGVHTSPNVRLISNGQGTRTGIGTGSDGGDGPGHGPGTGPGQDSGYGDSIYRPGIGGVSKPIPVVAPEAEFSDEARRQQYQGVCIVSIIVDAHGNPQNPRVTRPLGMGLDEKALEAVQKYRFKPAMKDGKPVASYVTVQINFRLY
jgi:TonB family protein